MIVLGVFFLSIVAEKEKRAWDITALKEVPFHNSYFYFLSFLISDITEIIIKKSQC